MQDSSEHILPSASSFSNASSMSLSILSRVRENRSVKATKNDVLINFEPFSSK